MPRSIELAGTQLGRYSILCTYFGTVGTSNWNDCCFRLVARVEKKFDHRDTTINGETKAWRDIWAAGHGVRAIHSVQYVAEIIAELKADYIAARGTP